MLLCEKKSRRECFIRTLFQFIVLKPNETLGIFDIFQDNENRFS